jgi:hypothetical protein
MRLLNFSMTTILQYDSNQGIRSREEEEKENNAGLEKSGLEIALKSDCWKVLCMRKGAPGQ